LKNIIVGLTGPTGAGKSMVAHRCLARGYGVVDGDIISREICQNGSPVIKKLAEAFGGDIVNPGGSLNRRLLGKRAFSSKENVALLNKITHPPIIEEMERQISEIFANEKNVAVVDAAALIESGFTEKCDLVAVVYSPSEIRLERIMTRDGLDEKTARQRISAQMPVEFYKQKADIIINNCPPYDLEMEMQAFFQKVEKACSK